MSVKLSEMPDGTVVEIYGERYEKDGLNWKSIDGGGSFYTLGALDTRQRDAKILSVSYELTLKIAEWLDEAYPNRIGRGTPESIIIEAAKNFNPEDRDGLPQYVKDIV